MEEEVMAEGNNAPKLYSGGGWTFPPMPFSGASLPGQPHVTVDAARASLMGLEMMESWLAASRQMIDLWRMSVRDTEDRMVALYRRQVVDHVAHDMLEQFEVPSQVTAKRQPLPQTAVAKPDAARSA